MNGWIFNPVGGYGLVTAVAAVLLVVMMLTNPQMRRMPPTRRWTLAGIRLAVFLLIIAALLRPTRIFTEIKEKPATLALLVDRSKSMQTEDAFGDRTRWNALRETLTQALPQLSNMGENLEVKVYAFDRDVSPLDFSDGKLDLGKSADGSETAIGSALDDVLRRETGKRLAGVILLSDGAQQALRRAICSRNCLPGG